MRYVKKIFHKTQVLSIFLNWIKRAVLAINLIQCSIGSLWLTLLFLFSIIKILNV